MFFYFLEKLAIHNEYLYISAVINQNSTCFFPFYMFMLQNLQKKSAVYQKRPTQKHSSHYATYSRLSLPITNRIPLYFNPSCKRAQKAILWVSLYPWRLVWNRFLFNLYLFVRRFKEIIDKVTDAQDFRICILNYP